MESIFTKLAAIDCSKQVEKKNGFSYLSWAYAVKELRTADPSATWEVKRFNDMPFMVTPLGVFVEVAVTVAGITLSQIHPVLDHRNKPIASPDSFQINTSIQRCLVKAISLHGLGLYIYAGEDLPEESKNATNTLANAVTDMVEAEHPAESVSQYIADQKLDKAGKKQLWDALPDSVKTYLKG